MLDRSQFNGALDDSQYTGRVVKGWAQRVDGTWEMGRSDYSQAPVVISDAQAQGMSNTDRGPYAVGQGGFFGGLMKDAGAISPLLSLIPGVGPLAAAAASTASNLFGGGGGGGGNTGAGGSTGSPGGANAAANTANSNVNTSIASQNTVGNTLLQRYQNAAPAERQVLDFYYNQAFPGAPPLSTQLTQAAPTPTATNTFANFAPGQGTSLANYQTGGAVVNAPIMQSPNINGGKPFVANGARATWAAKNGATVVHPAGSTVSTDANGNPIYTNPGQSTGTGAGTGANLNMQDTINNAVLGIYNSEPYKLARQSAQNSINSEATNLGNAYNHNLLARGLQNSSLATGGQAGIIANAGKNFSDFTRNLGINAVNEENNRVGQLNAALAPSLNSLPQAGQQFNSAGNLSQQNLNTNLGQSNVLREASGIPNPSPNYGQLGTTIAGLFKGSGGDSGGGVSDAGVGNVSQSGVNQDPNPTPAETSWMNTGAAAHGGLIPGGSPTLVGERGPEMVMPARGGGKEPTINIPHSIFAAWLAHTMHGGTGSSPAPAMMAMGQGAPPSPSTLAQLLASMPMRATGGGMTANQPYLVGEHGPEVIIPQQSGYVIPHSPADMTDQSASQLSRLDPMFLQLHRMYSGQ